MDKITALPDNIINKEDRIKLESFGGHEIARGRATRFAWESTQDGSPVFSLYRGGAKEEHVFCISHNRTEDRFEAHDDQQGVVVHGTLSYVMAVLDQRMARDHGETIH